MTFPFIRALRTGLAATLVVQMTLPASAKKGGGQIDSIDIAESETSISVTVHGQSLGNCQPSLVRDTKTGLGPKLFLTFDDTTIASSAQGSRLGKEPIISVDALMPAGEAKRISQVIVAFESETTYHLKRQSDAVVVTADRKAKPAVEVSAAPAKASSRQMIQAGDQLYFSVSPAEELSREMMVDQNGRISLPLIGAVDVVGMSSDALARKLSRMLSQYVTNPKVDVLIRQYSANQISLMGQVRSPGTYPFRSNLRLLDLVSMGGGFNSSANKSQIRVYRGSGASRRATIVDVNEALKTGDVAKDFVLQAGDLVDVPKGVSPLIIFGDVEHGGTYEYFKEMRLLDLIAQTNGFNESANYRKIRIFRGEAPNQKTIVVRFGRVLDGKMDGNVLLEPGDIVYVPKRPLWTYSAIAQTITPLTAFALTAATVYLAAKK